MCLSFKTCVKERILVRIAQTYLTAAIGLRGILYAYTHFFVQIEGVSISIDFVMIKRRITVNSSAN